MIATSPETKEIATPNTMHHQGMDSEKPLFARSMVSTTAEPKMTGIDIRKEKFEAVFLSTPRKVKLDIVAPLLDTPGRTAIP